MSSTSDVTKFGTLMQVSSEMFEGGTDSISYLIEDMCERMTAWLSQSEFEKHLRQRQQKQANDSRSQSRAANVVRRVSKVTITTVALSLSGSMRIPSTQSTPFSLNTMALLSASYTALAARK